MHAIGPGSQGYIHTIINENASGRSGDGRTNRSDQRRQLPSRQIMLSHPDGGKAGLGGVGPVSRMMPCAMPFSPCAPEAETARLENCS